jgi:hypothetical protein
MHDYLLIISDFKTVTITSSHEYIRFFASKERARLTPAAGILAQRYYNVEFAAVAKSQSKG